MSLLKISSVPQYGVLVEKQYSQETSIFHNVYMGAAKNVCDIIEQNKKILSLAEKDRNIYGNMAAYDCFINPMIAFVGDRGTGKSSAMCSFANFLECCTTRDSCAWIDNEDMEAMLTKNKFYVLPTIDASQLGVNQTIIGNMSASMYKIYESKRDKMPVDKQRDFVANVKSVNNVSTQYMSGEWFKPGDKLLNDTKKVCDLKEDVIKMIQQFLGIVVTDYDPKTTHLVLKIDDLDMGIKNCYSILEEIRKFLTIPNLIILSAVHSDQMRCILKAKFKEEIHADKMPETEWLTEDLSYRYMEKLFPYKRQHHMPELTADKLKQTLAVHFLYNHDIFTPEDKYGDSFWNQLYKQNNISIAPNYNNKVRPSVLDAILHLIWRKTMIIPVCNRYGEYPIIPTNLRSLCNFVIFLRNMSDVALEQVDNSFRINSFEDFTINNNMLRTTLEKNIDAFEKYIIEHISPIGHQHQNDEDLKLTRTLLSVIENMPYVPLENMNAKIVSDILYFIRSSGKSNWYFSIFFKKSNNISDDYNSGLLLAAEYPDVIGIGDVMYVLGKLEKHTRCSYIRYLISLIRALWSARMTRELYVVGCGAIIDTCEPGSSKITESFRKAVGGFVFNPDHIGLCNSSVTPLNWGFYDHNNPTVDKAICTLFSAKAKNDQAIYLNGKCSFEYVKSENDASKMLNWQSHLGEGTPYFRCPSLETKQQDPESITVYASHPLALFTNLMSLNTFKPLINASCEKLLNELIKWQAEHIVILPFNSLDFMSRFYDDIQKVIRASGDSKIDVFILIEKSLTALDNTVKQLLHYIPCETKLKEPIESFSLILDKYDTFKQKISEICDSLLNNTDNNEEVHNYDELLDSLKVKVNDLSSWTREAIKIVGLIDKTKEENPAKIPEMLKTIKEQLNTLHPDSEPTETDTEVTVDDN